MKKIMMVCESFGGGVFTYVSQLCNDIVDKFDVYLVYSIRPQTPKNYKEYIDSRVKLIELEDFGKSSKIIKTIKKLRDLKKEINPDIIHLHSSLAGGIGRLAFKGNNIIYTPHGYAHILMGRGIKSKIYKFAEKLLGNRAITLTCCESENDEAKKFCKKTSYIETGINLDDLSKSLSNIATKKMIVLLFLLLVEFALKNSHKFLMRLQNWYQKLNLFGLAAVSLKQN